VRVQAVAGFGVGACERVDSGLRERCAERGGAAELVVGGEQLLAGLREREVPVVDALDVQRGVFGGEARARR
jgi:hypothetical protein